MAGPSTNTAGTLTINNCKFFNNHASGGAIYNGNSGSVLLCISIHCIIVVGLNSVDFKLGQQQFCKKYCMLMEEQYNIEEISTGGNLYCDRMSVLYII